MKPFPSADSSVRRIRLRTLLSQLSTLTLGTLVFFMRGAFGGSLDDVVCGRQCHVREKVTTLLTAYTSA